jgi:hypothetical protein
MPHPVLSSLLEIFRFRLCGSPNASRSFLNKDHAGEIYRQDMYARTPDSLGRSLFVAQTAKSIDRAGEAHTSAARSLTPALIQMSAFRAC